MLARSGKKNGFAVLFPRGRLGIGPGRDRNTWAWPGSPETQKLYEDEVIGGWLAEKARLEQREGRFDEVFVFGFSNGAYYATTLAMRGRLTADGYGVFAGGSGSAYNRILAQNLETRAPVFVGYGTKDPDHHRQIALVDLLQDFHWPHHSMSARVGHMVTDSQLDAAVEFLRSKREPGNDEGAIESPRGTRP
jgi:predicted esterase